MFNRNNNCNTGGKCKWLICVSVILILAVTFFGAKDQIKLKLQEYLSLPNQEMNKQEIENIVYEFIKKNPDVIISSLKEMQKREYEDSLKQAKIAIKNSKSQLQSEDISLIAGDKNGDVTIVTFLDYRCGYCKKANNALKSVLLQDKKVKVIYKEYPVLGGASRKLAQTALAVAIVKPSKYVDFHNSLMDARDPSDEFIRNTLKLLNIDHIKVKEAMNDPRVEKELASVQNLTRQLNVRGTPAFIIGDELIPGAIDSEAMLKLVKSTREKNKEEK